ncbi:MAG TPA: glycine oxidase ThiO [Gemmatimonadales bacterium]|nr:glycine oxidase ThiO [Gemmatimonadales bacterium]
MAPRVSAVDVAVVGGGVIGAACARAAARRGLAVALFEPGPEPGAASPASAGMLAAQIEPGEDAQLDLLVRARDLYAELAPTLEDSTGIAIGFWRQGIAALAFDPPGAELLREQVSRQRQAGLRAEWLEAEEVRSRWPGVNPACQGAQFSPEDGALDPEALTRALLADARRLGATLFPERVEQIRRAGNQTAGVVTAQRTVPAAHVLVAAGAWSPLIAGLPRRLPVEPVRGQLATTPWPPGTPPAILYHHHCYVVARGSEALLGSTMERAGFEPAVTTAGLAQIFRAAVELLPALASAPVSRMWAGLRPMSPDGAPIVGPDPELAGLWYATGHGRSGILLAALTGEAVADLLTTGTTSVDVSAWRVSRFTDG